LATETSDPGNTDLGWCDTLALCNLLYCCYELEIIVECFALVFGKMATEVALWNILWLLEFAGLICLLAVVQDAKVRK
jgi:hypothetical protein